MRAFSLFLFSFLISFSAFAEIQTACDDLNVSVEGRYCVSTDTESSSSDLLYYFHGFSGNETQWKKYSPIQKIWRREGLDGPRVVTISFGPAWLLIEKNSRERSGLFEVFLDEVMPQLEARLGFDGSRHRRFLIGASMGGFNASQMLLKAPHLFDRVALICPAITSFGPYSSAEEVWSFIFRTGANPILIGLAIDVAKKYFPDHETWLKAAPLELSRNKMGPIIPPFYISCGSWDEFGLYEGSKLFAEQAQARGVDVTWKPHPMRTHCAIDTEAIASFMLQ